MGKKGGDERLVEKWRSNVGSRGEERGLVGQRDGFSVGGWGKQVVGWVRRWAEEALARARWLSLAPLASLL